MNNNIHLLCRLSIETLENQKPACTVTIKTTSLSLGQFSDRLKIEMLLRRIATTRERNSRHNCYYIGLHSVTELN